MLLRYVLQKQMCSTLRKDESEYGCIFRANNYVRTHRTVLGYHRHIPRMPLTTWIVFIIQSDSQTLSMLLKLISKLKVKNDMLKRDNMHIFYERNQNLQLLCYILHQTKKATGFFHFALLCSMKSIRILKLFQAKNISSENISAIYFQLSYY